MLNNQRVSCFSVGKSPFSSIFQKNASPNHAQIRDDLLASHHFESDVVVQLFFKSNSIYIYMHIYIYQIYVFTYIMEVCFSTKLQVLSLFLEKISLPHDITFVDVYTIYLYNIIMYMYIYIYQYIIYIYTPHMEHIYTTHHPDGTTQQTPSPHVPPREKNRTSCSAADRDFVWDPHGPFPPAGSQRKWWWFEQQNMVTYLAKIDIWPLEMMIFETWKTMKKSKFGCRHQEFVAAFCKHGHINHGQKHDFYDWVFPHVNIYRTWLMVYLPLWKIWKSVGIMTFPIYGNS